MFARKDMAKLIVLLAWVLLLAKGADALNLFSLPPVISKSVPPNVVLTFDNSKSMINGFTPDVIEKPDEGLFSSNQYNKAVKSSYVNKLYFDPNTVYGRGLNADGSVISEGSFFSARSNPYNDTIYAETAIVDLSSSYVARWKGSYRTNPLLCSIPGLSKEELVTSHCPAPAYYYEYIPSADCNMFYPTAGKGDLSPYRVLPPDECFKLHFVSEAQQQNFTNWYEFHSLRTLAAKTAASLVFSEKNFPSVMRFAWQGLNAEVADETGPRSGPMSASVKLVSTLDYLERDNFYQWLFAIGGEIANTNSTPLRGRMIDAGEFFAKPENLRKHPEIPVSADNPVVSCRANFNILMTDGQWNVKLGSDVMSGIARDEDDVNLPDGKSYSGSNALYASKFKASALGDSTDSPVTLADVAFHYWKTDLSDESDNVKKLMRNVSGLEADDYWDPLNDPATWQHMSNYIVSFGVTGTIDPSIESVKALESGELSWPPIQYDSEERSRDAVLSYTRPAKIDDLYHAAINSRGDYYGSQSSDELVAGLKRAVSSITDSIESNTQVVINTGTISSGTVIYQAVYDGPNGIGRLAAKPISDGSLAATEGAEGCNSRPVGSVCDVTRDAGWDTIDSIHPSTVNDFASTRQLFTSVLNEETSLRRLQAFRWSGLTASQQQRMLEAVKDSLSLGIDWSADDLDAELAGSVLGTQMLDYIRGQDVLEVDEVDGLFRNRHHARLGPVVNASPLYVSNGVKADGSQERYFPDDLEGEGSARYQDFLCSGARLASATPCATGSIYNRTPVVYVNSNDGMLHAFDASLYDDDGNPASGKELFAYLPDLLLEKVSASVLPSYSYEAMADGPLSSADVYYDASWHSVLIGGLRSGGKGYYALDVTQPEMYTEARVSEGANPVLWEFTHEELGYSYSQAVIVKSNYRSPSGSTGKWVAIFGNGYNSHSHQASLFIVDIETGALIKHISTGVGSADSENGMGTPAVIFNDSGYTADYAYVGDLLGNMWKFDLRSSNPDDWDLAYRSSSEEAATPFFTAAKLDDATDRMVPQPIMAAPLVAAHPSGREGNMLYFGTGKYLEASDHSAGGVVQTFYGLWDKDECRSAEGLKACAKQAASANMVRSAPSPLLQQTLTSESHAERGARVTTAHAIEWEGEHAKRGWYLDLPASSGERVISQPVVSGLNVYFATFIPGLNVCDGGGESWLMALNKTTGGTPTMQPFDHDNNGLIDGGDHHSGSKTSGIKLDAYSAGVGTIARCGSNLCVYASDKPQISEDGVFEGRWRWRQLQ